MQYGILVQRALKKNKEQREVMRRDVLVNVFQAIEQLAAQTPFGDVFVFGSVAKPYTFTEKSDVDVGFWHLEDKHYFFTMAFLSRELERDVDVIQLENAPERLRSTILREGITWRPKRSIFYTQK